MKARMRIIVGSLIISMVVLPIESWSLQVQYLGQPLSVTGADKTVTQYQYDGTVSRDSGHYLHAALGSASTSQDIYVPVTLPGNSAIHDCQSGDLCARVLGNGNIILYDYRYNAKTNPYRSLSQQRTYRPLLGGKSYQLISQIRDRYSLNGQLVHSGSLTVQQVSAGQSVISHQTTIITQNQYDQLGRIVLSDRTDQKGAAVSRDLYRYDANSNVLKQSGSQVLTAVDNGLDQAVLINSHSVAYDGNGNQKNTVSGDTYHFNARNQLVGYQSLATSAHSTDQYGYYSNGYRASKQLSDTQLSYYYDGDQLFNAVDSRAQQVSDYLLADGRLYRSLTRGQLQSQPPAGHYLLLGHNSNVNGNLDNTGQLISSQHYDAYGRVISTGIAGNAVTRQSSKSAMTTGGEIQQNPFSYDGEYRDAETGLSYLRARYYNPKTMRFIGQDSYNLMNRYNFANGDPVDRLDPTGHDSVGGFFKQLGLSAAFTLKGAFDGFLGATTFGMVTTNGVTGDFLGWQQMAQGLWGQWAESFNPISAILGSIHSHASINQWNEAVGLTIVGLVPFAFGLRDLGAGVALRKIGDSVAAWRRSPTPMELYIADSHSSLLNPDFEAGDSPVIQQMSVKQVAGRIPSVLSHYHSFLAVDTFADKYYSSFLSDSATKNMQTMGYKSFESKALQLYAARRASGLGYFIKSHPYIYYGTRFVTSIGGLMTQNQANYQGTLTDRNNYAWGGYKLPSSWRG